jgi:phage-related protein
VPLWFIAFSSASINKGFGGPSVLDIVAPHETDTYHSVYTVRYRSRIYVLHCFQKKSKRGLATPKKDLDLINQRLATAELLSMR